MQSEITLLIRLSEIVSFAESLPLDIICQRNTEPKYPVTIGELLVSYALNIVIRHDWELNENEYIVEPLINCLTQLDMGVDRPDAWKELFTANNQLKDYINNSRKTA